MTPFYALVSMSQMMLCARGEWQQVATSEAFAARTYAIDKVGRTGPVTAVAYVAALEKPDTFKRSRAVGAWLGLTARRFQSGEVDYVGHISRRGDGQLRALLYEAAAVLLTRVRRESALRSWGLLLRKRLGFKRAATGLARRMAVVLHAMWKSATPFNPALGATTP
jgi:transposase